MCARFLPLPVVAPSSSDLDGLVGAVHALMTDVQVHGLGVGVRGRWEELEPRLGAVVDAAIVAVPDAARRLVSAFQYLGWRLRAGEVPSQEVEDDVVDRLAAVLESLVSYRDGMPVGADRSATDLMTWLAATLGVPQLRVAGLLGISLRTVQRWLRGETAIGPNDDAHIRRLARLVNEARFALTPAGVDRWLDRPTPYLGGASPAVFARSDEDGADAALSRLTATLRYA